MARCSRSAAARASGAPAAQVPRAGCGPSTQPGPSHQPAHGATRLASAASSTLRLRPATALERGGGGDGNQCTYLRTCHRRVFCACRSEPAAATRAHWREQVRAGCHGCARVRTGAHGCAAGAAFQTNFRIHTDSDAEEEEEEEEDAFQHGAPPLQLALSVQQQQLALGPAPAASPAAAGRGMRAPTAHLLSLVPAKRSAGGTMLTTC